MCYQLVVGNVTATWGDWSNWGRDRVKYFAASPIQHVEDWLDRERDRLPLWLPIGVGAGIAVWESYWDNAVGAVLLIAIALVLAGILAGSGKRIQTVLIASAVTFAIGYAAIGLKSRWISAPVLGKVVITRFYARIENVQSLPARDVTRLTLATGGHAGLPNRVRVNLDLDQYRPEFKTGSIIELRARLMPPAPPMLPGGYDFARRAWFSGIGATGTALGKVELYQPSPENLGLSNLRGRLTAHIRENLSVKSGGIGAALITGDTGATVAWRIYYRSAACTLPRSSAQYSCYSAGYYRYFQ
jgi:competence protein ComEC